MTFWPCSFVLVANHYQDDILKSSVTLCEYETREVAERMSIIAEVVMNERLSDDLFVSVSVCEKWLYQIEK